MSKKLSVKLFRIMDCIACGKMCEMNFDVGNTRLVEFKKIRDAKSLGCHIFGKLECENPAGSTKDRIVKQILDDAITSGQLRESDEIVEATSGNTGIALAAYGSILGHAVKIFMPENMSKQRVNLMKKYGAEVALTPASENVEGSIKAMKKYISVNKNCFAIDQFNNVSNVNAHYENTACEIWEQTDGAIDAFIAGIGTGGTIAGVGKFLKEQNPKIQVVAVLPAETPHVIQGIGDGFEPLFFADNEDIDKVIKITNAEAIEYFDWINNTEGESAGISSGANLCAALKLYDENPALNNIVIMCADGANRY